MRRREFILAFGGAAVACPFAGRAQQPERVRRIGVLMYLAADDAEGQARLVAFAQALKQLGWSDGRNLRIDTRWANADDIRKHAAELVALAPDVLLAAPGTTTVAPLLQATRTVPIVFVSVIDPVGEKRLQDASFLVLDLVRTIEAVIASQSFYRRRRREHAIRLTCRLHARSDVDGIAPDVVGELARADHPCHHGAGMQAHPDRKRDRQPRPQSPSGSNRVESEFRRHPGVIGARRRYAGDRHVVVADRLYLFDPDIFSKLVEFAEQLIEAGDDFIGFHAGRDFAEADDVGKNDSGVIEMICDVAFPVAQACCDLSRQNVAQEVLGMPLFVLDLAHI